MSRTPFTRVSLLFALLLSEGCASYRPMNPPLEEWKPDHGYRVDARKQKGHSDEILFLVAFSGGGTRAAAFSYGVLEELAETPINGADHTLIEEIDIVSGVSGGSIIASYYGLYGDRTFEDFEERFLNRNFQRTITTQLLRPWNWFKLFSPHFSRSDLTAQYYDRFLYEGATFADLAEKDGPTVLINSTDLFTGSPFSFIQSDFDYLCSDLAPVSISRAVSASTAVPLLFAPIHLKNYAGKCDFTPPPDMEEALKHPEKSERRNYVAQVKQSYLTPGLGRRVHLVDGGVSDNLGVHSIFDKVFTSNRDEIAKLRNERIPGVRHLVIIVVNAETQPSPEQKLTDNVPTLGVIMNSITNTQISRYNFETMELLKSNFSLWEKIMSTPENPIAFHVIDVSFKEEKDSEERVYLQNVPTSFKLKEEQVTRLRAAGRSLLRQQADYQRLLRDLKNEK